jgi:DNA-directed RNA polymerase subunit RPC12/RpoP
MDKTTDEFCPDCGHHLYKFKIISPGKYFCIECGQWLDPEQAASLHQVEDKRREFMTAWKADE